MFAAGVLAGVLAGVVGTVIGELLVGLAIWLWLTRRRDDLPEECD